MNNLWEYQKGTDPNVADPVSDTDGDMLPDEMEMSWWGSIECSNCGRDDDPDDDGLSNLQEYQLEMRPATNDWIDCGDGDGLYDPWEYENFGNYDQGPDDDYDNDGYTNWEEYILDSDPTVAETVYTTIQITISGNGKVIAQDGTEIEESGDFLITASFDQTYSFTFVADEHHSIKNVSVDSLNRELVDNTIEVTRVVNHRVKVTFIEGPYTIETSVEGSGTIDPMGPIVLDKGGSQTFTITPAEGSFIKSVSVDGTPLSYQPDQYTFSEVTEDHTLDVVFATIPVITTSMVGSGTINPSGEIVVTPREDQTFSITPDDGYYIGSVYVDGALLWDTQSSYTFENITSDHTLHVVFDAEVSIDSDQDGLPDWYEIDSYGDLTSHGITSENCDCE